MESALGLLMKNFCRDPFGLVVSDLYHFTNDSTLRQWPFVLTLGDVARGTVASAACAAAVRFVVQ